MTSRFIRENAEALDGIRLLHLNHHLDDVLLLDELLRSVGVRSEFIPIPYAQRAMNDRTLWRDRFMVEVQGQLRRLQEPVVVLEDGGYLVQAAIESKLSKQILFAVEQTRFGAEIARKARDAGRLDFPVLSCARATVKCRVESAALAVRLCDFLSEFVASAGVMLIGRDVLQLGYGILGRPVAIRLRNEYRCNVTIYDTDDHVLEVARADGFITYDAAANAHADIVLGTSGKPSLTYAMLASLMHRRTEPLVLASISSGDIEFSQALSQAYEENHLDMSHSTSELWGTRVQGPVGQIRLLADGRPINFFYHGRTSLPSSFADLTNFRLVEALTAQRRYGFAQGGTVFPWASIEAGPWLSDEALLSEFCSANGYRCGPNSIDFLRELGLYAQHPSEAHLGVGVE